MAEEMSRERAEKLLRGGPEGIKEWNEWRDLRNKIPDLSKFKLSHAHLEGADLSFANLEGVKLEHAHLEGAKLRYSNLTGADLGHAHLEGAGLSSAYLKGARFSFARLEGADLSSAYLKGARFISARLERADLSGAHLEGAKLEHSNLKGAELVMATVDGVTLMSEIIIDDKTDMTGVGLGNVRIEPHIRSRLEYNVRRIGWKKRYKESWRHRVFSQCFFWTNDYGYSTSRIIIWFSGLALFFALVYMIPTPSPLWGFWPTFECEPLIANLDSYVAHDEIVDSVIVPKKIPLGFEKTFVRSFYFSVVTMTTLGFGDIYADPQSVLGHILLMIQVILGYVLLGALITRFAILFQSVE